MTRAHMDAGGPDVHEAQRLLNQARNALQAAGLQDVEARITQLQRRLKTAEERARQLGVAKGIALHQLEAAHQTRTQQAQTAEHAEKQLAERNNAFGALLHAVADSLDLPANQVDDPVRYARQMTKGRDSRARLEEDLPRAYSAAEREQEGFLVAVAEYQALVGADDRFGLRPPTKRELQLAPQGWLLDVARAWRAQPTCGCCSTTSTSPSSSCSRPSPSASRASSATSSSARSSATLVDQLRARRASSRD